MILNLDERAANSRTYHTCRRTAEDGACPLIVKRTSAYKLHRLGVMFCVHTLLEKNKNTNGTSWFMNQKEKEDTLRAHKCASTTLY